MSIYIRISAEAILNLDLFKPSTLFRPEIQMTKKFTLNLGQFEQITVPYTGFTEHAKFFADSCISMNRNTKGETCLNISIKIGGFLSC